MTFDLLFMLLTIGSLVPLTLFPIVFALAARHTWWRTPAGRALMVSTTSLSGVLWVVLARQLFGEYPYRETVLLIVFSGVFLGAWLKFGALIYELRQGRHSPRSDV